MPETKPDFKERLRLFLRNAEPIQLQRALDLFDKFDAIDHGPQIYAFLLRNSVQQLSSSLDKLEEIYKESRTEMGRFLIGMKLFQALRD